MSTKTIHYIARPAPKSCGKGSILVTTNDAERFVLTPTRVNGNGFSIYFRAVEYDDEPDENFGSDTSLTEDGMASDTKEAWTWAAQNLAALAEVCAKEAAKPAMKTKTREP